MAEQDLLNFLVGGSSPSGCTIMKNKEYYYKIVLDKHVYVWQDGEVEKFVNLEQLQPAMFFEELLIQAGYTKI
tara:strand:- start:7083 stop:7301 length:219 start_codon:yes stop_codon:yes gene_type:complete